MNIATWINAHWENILTIIATIAGIARFAVKVLPAPEPGSKYEAWIELLKHIALSIPAPKESASTAISNVAKDASKTATVGILAAGLTLGGCASFQAGVSDLVATIKKDVPEAWNVLSALWSKFESAASKAQVVLDAPAFVALLESFKVPASTISDWQSTLADANGKITLTTDVLKLIQAQIPVN